VIAGAKAIETLLLVMARDIGDDLRPLARATRERMGQGGTATQWFRAMAEVIAESGDAVAAAAFKRALTAVERLPE
jgi:hypothetical protein